MNIESFQKEVVLQANQILLDISLGNSKNSLPNPIPNEKGVKNEIHNVEELIEESEEIVKTNNKIREVLCRSLNSVSNDLTEISKIVAAALFPFAISSTPIIPLNSLIFSGIAVVVFNAGIKAVCPENNSKK